MWSDHGVDGAVTTVWYSGIEADSSIAVTGAFLPSSYCGTITVGRPVGGVRLGSLARVGIPRVVEQPLPYCVSPRRQPKCNIDNGLTLLVNYDDPLTKSKMQSRQNLATHHSSRYLLTVGKMVPGLRWLGTIM